MKTDLLLKIYLAAKKVKVKYPPSRKVYNVHLYGCNLSLRNRFCCCVLDTEDWLAPAGCEQRLYCSACPKTGIVIHKPILSSTFF